MFTAHLRTAEDIGIALQQARLAAKLTQRELAEEISVSQRYIWEMESGKHVAAITRLLDAFRATDVELRADIPEGDVDG